jgi:hypothetical protein
VYDNNGRVQKDPTYAVELKASLHNAERSIVREAAGQRASRAPQRPSGGHGFTLQLPLRDLPAGAYVLRVEARSTQKLEVVSRSVALRVK